MATEKNLRESLLQQDNYNNRTAAELRDKILARDEARVRRMKWIAGICWVLFLISLVLAALVEASRRYRIAGLTTSEAVALFPEYEWFVPMAIIITQTLLIIAVAMTFSLYVRSRTLTMHQIQARLATIEEQLRRLAEKG
jgi:hypothetical protein